MIDSVGSCVLSANPLNVFLEGAVVGQSLHADAITFDFAFLLKTVEVRHNVVSETVLSGEEDNLTTGELETSSVEGFLGVLDKLWLGSDGDENLVNVDTSSLDVRLSEGLTHSLLESIGTSAGKHLVDTDGVPWVNTDAHVEGVLTSLGGHVLVCSDTCRFKRFRTDHFLLFGDEMDAAGEVVPL